ncbi:ralA-binding protein 1 isoform X1 [Ixodes scapularis]|uniref:ralA-binding protein 1 isoform X1 n=1 Tax=Ixodes scapularis TaxID=6945 RepID=UPI001C38FFB7|nr:ralA-binding protein 1 isoform X1 [Ixodes scapularis]XP_042146839.1 ralA-binding protein 1 isoform X1 [Ixodes scapularis]
MDFESPDVEKDFPGLYASESIGKSQERDANYSDEEKVSKKELLIGKLKDKKEKKDKGYVAFEGESSDGEMDESKGKGKKSKAPFKFPGKEKKEKSLKSKDSKDGPKSKDSKEAKKDPDRDSKKKKESKVKLGKKKKKHELEKAENPIFGVPLLTALERNPSHDGVELPALVRECIDYIEEHGMTCEGIYRMSGVKSKVQQLRARCNRHESLCLSEHEPHVVASLLKQFLRELPDPVLTSELCPKFEEAASIKDETKRVEAIQRLIEQLPNPNRLLLSWVFVHMTNVIRMEKHNKMNLQNVSIVLSPSMQISHRVLHALFSHASIFFKDVQLKKYVRKIHPDSSRQSLDLPETPAAIEEELSHQEQVLNEIHAELNAGLRDPQKEEQLWEVQRVVTQLKRKLRVLKQVKKVPPEVPAPDTGDSIDTRLQLPPVPEQAGQPSEPAKTVLAPPPSMPQGPKVIACKMSASASAGHVLSEAVAVQNGTVQPTPRSSTTPLDAGVSPSKPPGSREVVSEQREFASSVQEDAAGSGEMQATGDLKDDTCEKHLTEAGETDFVPPAEAKLSEEEEEVDPEMVVMRQEETELLLHQEELLSLGDELRRKIAAERAEIERLRSEIVEYQKLAKYKQYSVESAECSSSGTEGSESEGEDELKQILSQLMDDNKQLSQQAAELSQKILKEREACVDIKVKMRLLQNEAKMLKI